MKFSKLTKPELEKIIKSANFTEDEESIFTMLCKGKSISEISFKISVSERTVSRRVSAIKYKIKKLEVEKWL